MEETSECRDSVLVEEAEPFTIINEVVENCIASKSNSVENVELPVLKVVENGVMRAFTAAIDSRFEPYVGMEFESEQATYSFYNEYARLAGFGVRKRFIRRSRIDSEVIGRTYVCSREGLKDKRREVEFPRPNTRLDCKAMMMVKRCGIAKWIVIKFIKEHNHELCPSSACVFQPELITTYRPTSSSKYSEITVPKLTFLATKQLHNVPSIHSMNKDTMNLVNIEQRVSLSAEDARTIYEYFMRAQVSNPRFFYAMELDGQQHMRNVFWVDTKARVTYTHFGDVVTFNTTCLTDKYKAKVVLFVGINHHGQSVLLGSALVTDDTKASLLWVLKTWFAVMQAGPPKAIITDQHETIKSAINEVFPETRHRFCLWHVTKRVFERLGNVQGFMYKFDKCIYDSLTVDEFEERWKKLIEAYGLADHKWLQLLYVDREQWVPVYLKDSFFAGMSISQRSESFNSFINGFISQNTNLKDFIDQYELTLQRCDNDEEKADLETYRTIPKLITGSPYENQMSSIYTTNIFQKFQGEILRIPSCNAVHIQQEGDKSTYLVKQLVMKTNGEKRLKDYRVIWNGSDKVSCICGLFGFNGYLCRHAMVVLFVVGVYEIPSHYILKRWTRDAKIVDICNGVEDSGPEFVVKCFSDLRADSIKLAEEGSISKERYKATKAFLKDALIKVTSMNKVPVTVPKKNSKEANLVT